jgi:hypothetical protein
MPLDPGDVPVKHLAWPTCFRIIPSRYPPVPLFERVAAEEDLAAVFAIEGLTNDRLRDEAGEIQLVLPEDRVSGPGAAYVMAAFTHVAPAGGRFTDGSFGAYYAAGDLATAIDETVYHRERFLGWTREDPIEVEMRVLEARMEADLHDLRGFRDRSPEIYLSDDYSASQILARKLRDAGSSGIVYESVRRKGGECTALLKPGALSRCRQTQHLGYVWDGGRISTVFRKKALRAPRQTRSPRHR